ncbi:MAG: DUF1697 domain-containing protein [Chitinophagales bacterium]
MVTFICILRGINVSGKNKILMQDLKALFESMSFKNVKTYIQSGNVVFDAKSTKNLETIIQQKIKEQYGFDVPVIIRTVDEITSILKQNPYLKQKNIELDKLHITFLSEQPSKENLTKINTYNFEPDVFEIIGNDVYLHCPNGYGNTKLSNTFFENKLKVTATTRNWKTVNEIAKLCNQ